MLRAMDDNTDLQISYSEFAHTFEKRLATDPRELDALAGMRLLYAHALAGMRLLYALALASIPLLYDLLYTAADAR
eukprot:3258500-Rhodomonas_salina.2